MTDQELADKVVALGVGEFRPQCNAAGIYLRSVANYGMPDDLEHEFDCDKFFVRDWRVAGALMEKCNEVAAWQTDDGWKADALKPPIEGKAINESLPRAIIEACVESLGENK